MLISRLKPYITVVSEVLNKKKHGDIVVVGGEIKSMAEPMQYDDDYSPGIIFIDDSIGQTLVEVPFKVYRRDTEHIAQGNIVLIKGFVHEFILSYKGKETKKEHRVLASSIIPLHTAEKRRQEHEE